MSVDRRLVFGAVLVAVVANLFVVIRKADEQGADRRRIHEMSRSLLDEIRMSMIGATPIPRGDGRWLERLDLGDAPPIASAKLPPATGVRGFGKESEPGRRTGNALLFATPAGQVRILDGRQRVRRVQAYRMVAYYLTPVGDGPGAGIPGGLNLARYVSVPVVDLAEIEADGDVEARRLVLGRLARRPAGREVGWACRRTLRGSRASDDSGGPPDGGLPDGGPPAGIGFFRIEAESGRLLPGDLLPADPDHVRPALLPAQAMAVASNFDDPNVGVASFARRSDARGGYPHGFEVQLSSAGNRQVMVHLTLITIRSPAQVSADVRGIALVQGF